MLIQTLATSRVDAATIIVAPSGQSGAAGTIEAPLASLTEAAERAQPGDVIRLVGGTYKPDHTIRLISSGTARAPIRIEPADSTRPVVDFSGQQSEQSSSGLVIEGDFWHLVGLEVVNSARFGIDVAGQHNTVERCVAHENGGTGIQVVAPGSENLILNCDSYRNFDAPTNGQNADGFGAKFAIGPGNVFRGCRAWENADDGYDLWKAPHSVRIEHCVAFRNGINVWDFAGYEGNGNGFKVGGDFVPAPHVVIGCVATDQPKRGFDLNNNTGAIIIEKCTALRCKTGFALNLSPTTGQKHVLRDNLSFDGEIIYVEETISERNIWLNSDGTPVSPTILPSPGRAYVGGRSTRRGRSAAPPTPQTQQPTPQP